jgi:hypothetical protein
LIAFEIMSSVEQCFLVRLLVCLSLLIRLIIVEPIDDPLVMEMKGWLMREDQNENCFIIWFIDAVVEVLELVEITKCAAQS